MQQVGQFRHYRFGSSVREGLQDTIHCNVGPIIVDRSEVLNVSDAHTIVRCFLENPSGQIDGYEANDVTHQFLE